MATAGPCLLDLFETKLNNVTIYRAKNEKGNSAVFITSKEKTTSGSSLKSALNKYLKEEKTPIK